MMDKLDNSKLIILILTLKFILPPSFSFGFLLLFLNLVCQTRILSFPESFLSTDVLLEGELVLQVEVPVLYILLVALN